MKAVWCVLPKRFVPPHEDCFVLCTVVKRTPKHNVLALDSLLNNNVSACTHLKADSHAVKRPAFLYTVKDVKLVLLLPQKIRYPSLSLFARENSAKNLENGSCVFEAQYRVTCKQSISSSSTGFRQPDL